MQADAASSNSQCVTINNRRSTNNRFSAGPRRSGVYDGVAQLVRHSIYRDHGRKQNKPVAAFHEGERPTPGIMARTLETGSP
jgi:hypothetical protein